MMFCVFNAMIIQKGKNSKGTTYYVKPWDKGIFINLVLQTFFFIVHVHTLNTFFQDSAKFVTVNEALTLP